MHMADTSSARLISRRGALKLLAGGAGVTFLAACGSTPDAGSPAAAPASAATVPASSPAASGLAVSAAAAAKPAAGTPKSGGTLRFVATADIPNLDGHQRQSTLNDTTWTAYDRLIQYDENGKPQPMLAESWDVSPDFQTLKFNLRKGVLYHTGREFTSDDVKW